MLAWSLPGVKKTITLATTRQPETFTELYFEDHTHLPKEFVQPTPSTKRTRAAAISLNQKTYTFSFTIHNLENKDMSYHINVFKQTENDNTALEQKDIVVKNNESKTIQETFILADQHPKIKFVVDLTNKKQQIAFWMPDTEPRTIDKQKTKK